MGVRQGMVGRVSGALRRRSSSASCCFVGRTGGTTLRPESAGLSRRPPAHEASGCVQQESKVGCAGHVEAPAAPPGLIGDSAAAGGVPTPLQRTLSPAEQRRKSRPVTSKRCGATLRRRHRVGTNNVCFVFGVADADLPHFRFKPGQAVDVFVPLGGVAASGQFETKPGSYSVASTPKRLAETGEVELIVKEGGRGVPTRWLHNTAAIGDAVELCALGSFHYSSVAEDGPGPLLLIAGGLGINPLFSILAHAHETTAAAEPGPAITLLYSASSVEELTHKSEIEAIAASTVSNFNVIFTLTGDDESDAAKTDGTDVASDDADKESDASSSTEGSEGDGGAAEAVGMRRGRISSALIGQAIEGLSRRHIAASAATTDSGNTAAAKGGHATILGDLRCYICGPPGMIESTAEMVVKQGVQDTNIHFEKWW